MTFTFGKESQVEMLNGARPVLQASRHPNCPLSPPLTQPRLSNSQPGCEIPPSARSMAQRKRRERERVERAARQQGVSAMPVPATDLSATQPRQRRNLGGAQSNAGAIVGTPTMPRLIREQGAIRPDVPPITAMGAPPTPPATQWPPNNNRGKSYFLIFSFKV